MSNLNDVIDKILFEDFVPDVNSKNLSTQRVARPRAPGLSSEADSDDYEMAVNQDGQSGSLFSKSGGFKFSNANDLAQKLEGLFKSGIGTQDPKTGVWGKTMDFNAVAQYLIKVKGQNKGPTKDLTKDGKIINPKQADE